MSFSKENRKDVFNFFESLLSIHGEPIYYENLRGHVSKASFIVQKYVRKECKGEKLLDFFRKRKNYFVVDRYDVCLRKRFSSGEPLKPEEINELDDEDDEVFNDNDYSVSTSTRSASWVSSFQSTNENQPDNSDFNEEMIKDEELTNRYFCNYLSRNEKLYLNKIEFNDLPKKVQRYLKNYMNKKVLLFFQSFPHRFRVDDQCVMLLTNPPVAKESCYQDVQISEEISHEANISSEHFVSEVNTEDQNVENFLRCADFFVGILKKKGQIPLENLSGHLSQAPDILAYLQCNYKPFKLFFMDAPQLFILNHSDEISLHPDYGKLLKRARKMSRFKSANESLAAPVQNVIKSLFEMPLRIKRNSNSATYEIKKSEITDSSFSNLNVFIADNIKRNDDSSSLEIKYPKVSESVSNFKLHSKQEIPVSLLSSVSTQCIMQVNRSNSYAEINDHMHSKNTYSSNVPSTDLQIKECNEVDDRKNTHLIDAEQNLEESTAEFISVVESTDSHINECNKVDDRKNTSLIDAKQNLEESMTESISVVGSTDSNINECNKGDDRKNTSLIDAKQNSEESTTESISVVGSTDSNSNDSNKIDEMLLAYEYFSEYIYTIHMLCFEMVDKEQHLIMNHEYEAVKFFVDILKNPPGKVCEIKNLQGILGQASKEIVYFIKQLYKGEKFKNFFQKQDEFDVHSPSLLVQLSSNYETILETRLKEQKAFIKTESYFLRLASNSGGISDVFESLFKIIDFLKNKEKAKLSRMYSFVLKLPASFQDFINQIDCKQPSEKLRKFLAYFKIFILHEDSVSLNRDIDIPFLVNIWEDMYKEFAENQYKKFFMANYDYAPHLAKHYNYNLSEDINHVKSEIIQHVEEFLKHSSFINYSDLPKIFGPVVLYFLIKSDIYSGDIIWTLFASNLFDVDNGQISRIKPKPKVGNTNAITCMYNTVSEDPAESDETVLNMHTNIEDELLENEKFGNISCAEMKNQDIEFNSQNINGINLSPNNFVHINEYKNSRTDNLKVGFESPKSTNLDETEDQSRVSKIYYENNVQNRDERKGVLSDSSNYVISDIEINSQYEVLTSNGTVINDCSTGIKQIVDSDKQCKELCSEDNTVELPQVNLSEKNTVQNNILNKLEVSEQQSNSASLSVSQTLTSPMDINDHSKLSCKKIDPDEIYDIGSFFSSFNDSVEKVLICEDEINNRSFELDTTLDASLVQESNENVIKPDNIVLREDVNLNETAMISNERADTNDTDSANLCSVNDFSSSETFDVFKFATDLESDPFTFYNEILNDFEKQFMSNSARFLVDPNGIVYIKKSFSKVYTIDSVGNVYIDLPEENNIPGHHEDVFMKADTNDFEEQSKLHTDSIDPLLQNNTVIEEDAKSGHFVPENNFEPKKNEIVGTKFENVLSSVKPQSAETFIFNKEKSSESGTFSNEITEAFDNFGNETTSISESVFKIVSPSSSDSTAISKEVEDDISLSCIAEKVQLVNTKIAAKDQLVNTEIAEKDQLVNTEIAEKDQLVNTEIAGKDQLVNTEIAETAISLSASSVESSVNDKCMDYNTNKRTGDMNVDYVASASVNIEQNQDSGTMNDQNFTSSFLQPLSAKVVLLAIDSCIAETVFKGKKKLLFCLKSSFHCDLHNDCLKCFDSLKIDDTVSCCLHPSDGESKIGTMCISLMFCKDSAVGKEKCSDSDTSKIKKLHKRYQSQPVDQEYQDESDTCNSHIVKDIPYFGIDLNCSETEVCQESLNTKLQQTSSMVNKKCQTKFVTSCQNTQTACISSENGCQTKLSGHVKLQFPVVEKKCQASCSTASRMTQTFSKSCVNECQTEVTGNIKTCLSVVENGSQTMCLVFSQDTQTVYKSKEEECQTEVVKAAPCSMFAEKECQVNCSTISEHTQTANQSSENECQTDISGKIKLHSSSSSLGCQTDLSGRVKKYPYLANKSCQSVSIFSVDQISQTSSENTCQSIPISSVDQSSQMSENISSSPESNQMCQTFNILKLQAQSPEAPGVETAAMEREYCPFISECCDVSSQTIATGAIWIQQYYL